MVASADEILDIVRSNPFIDGIGYFIEVTTVDPVPQKAARALTERMQEDFCPHAQATLEGDHVLGFDFHEHVATKGGDGEAHIQALEALLKHVELEYGMDHLCIEFQFDLHSARKAAHEMDELLKP